MASQAAHSADWQYAPMISSLGLRLSSEAFRLTVGMRMRVKVSEEHKCPCGVIVDSKRTPGRTICPRIRRELWRSPVIQLLGGLGLLGVPADSSVTAS